MTRDTHSVCFSGGEPVLIGRFVLKHDMAQLALWSGHGLNAGLVWVCVLSCIAYIRIACFKIRFVFEK